METHRQKYLESLKNEIVANGNKIKVPLKVYKYKGEFYILDGHHRVRVAKELKIKEVPIEEIKKLPYGNYKTEQDLFY